MFNPFKIFYPLTHITSRPKQIKKTGKAHGRLFDSVAHCTDAIINLAIRIIKAILSFFGFYRPRALLLETKNEHNPTPTLATALPNHESVGNDETPFLDQPKQQVKQEESHTSTSEPYDSEAVENHSNSTDQAQVASETTSGESELVNENREMIAPIDTATPVTNAEINETVDQQVEMNAPEESESVDDKSTEIPTESNDPIAYIAKKQILLEKDQATAERMVLWVLTNAEESQKDQWQSMQQFISDFAKRSETVELGTEGAYCQWLESLTPEQLSKYAKLLQTTGSPPSLSYHLKREHQAAKLTGQSTLEKVCARLKIVFSTFTDTQGEALEDNHDFWSLIGLFPDTAAETLQADVLAHLAQNLERHPEFKKLLGLLPEDDQLLQRLEAIAPHASEVIEKELSGMTMRLKEHRKGLRRELSQKIKKGVDSNRNSMQLIDSARKSVQAKDLANEKAAKLRKKEARKETTEPIEEKPKILLPDDQCISYLTVKSYEGREDTETEDQLFEWILNREALYEDASFRTDIDKFITFTLSKPLYIETTEMRLKRMTTDQLEFFIKLLGEKNIATLWNLEAKNDYSQSEETNKIIRLRTVISTLSDEQFQTSLRCDKFFEVLRNYPKNLGQHLSIAQWKVLAGQNEREAVVLKTFFQLVFKLNTDEHPEFPQKLHAICHLVKGCSTADENQQLKIALKNEIERKLKLCPKPIRSQIGAILKQS